MNNLTAQELIYKHMFVEAYHASDDINFTDYSDFISYENLWEALKSKINSDICYLIEYCFAVCNNDCIDTAKLPLYDKTGFDHDARRDLDGCVFHGFIRCCDRFSYDPKLIGDEYQRIGGFA